VAKRLISILMFLLLASCGTRSSTPPTLDLLPRLAVTPALEAWVASSLTAYQDDHGPLEFTVEVLSFEAALEAAADGDVALVVAGWEPPSDWFSALLGVEGIAVVVHPGNPVRNYTLPDLAAVFAGRLRSWSWRRKAAGERATWCARWNRRTAGRSTTAWAIRTCATAKRPWGRCSRTSTAITILEEAPPQPKTYTVVKGDNLWSLAERFYGEGRRWKAIHQANRDVLPSPSMLKEGMVLLIPQAVPTTQPALPQRMSVERPAAAAPVATTIGTTHTVERGDTLYGLAQKLYGDGRLYTVLYEANRDRVSDPHQLSVGTVLVVPPAPRGGE